MTATTMETAAPTRTCVVTFEALPEGTISHLVTGALSLLGGGLGVEAFKRWAERRHKRDEEEGEFRVKILDEGDRFRTLLLEEVHQLREQCSTHLERAHVAEIQSAIAGEKLDKLKSRLERKDEQMKILGALLAEHNVRLPSYLHIETRPPSESS